jgi:glycosyltransferase involved in cell wall biosynthesis
VNRDSAFGRYSYPVKLYEAMACGVPIVAANVPGSAWILRDHPELLARPDDAGDFAAKAIAAIGRERMGYADISTWEASAGVLDDLLGQVTRPPAG